MDYRLFHYPFSRHFNHLMFLGVWTPYSGKLWANLIYRSYRMSVLVGLMGCIIFQGADLWRSGGNIEKMTYNLCTSVVTTGTTLKLVILLQKKSKLNGLRRKLWREHHRYNDAEDEVIKRNALHEMEFMAKMFLGASAVFLPVCLLLGFFSYLWGPRELPFPTFFPVNRENSLQYNIAFAIEAYSSFLILVIAIEIDLVVYSIVLQITSQYKILYKDILKVNQIYQVKDGHDARNVEVNFLMRRMETEKYLKSIVSRQRKLTQYVKLFEWGFNKTFLIQMLGGSILLIANGLQVIKMSYTINHKLAYEIVYIVLLIVDIYYNCHYMNTLTEQCNNVADAAYSVVWYDMDSSLRKYLLMVIIQAQRPPKITAGKLFEIDLSTFLSLVKNTYSWLMLFRQIEAK